MSKTIAPGQYRLATIQVYNWGTFGNLHTVDVAREGFLIFGPSGSGKSTLIDAVSTIIGVPGHHRFNAAATEAGKRSGRDIVTYCRGAWQKEHDAELDDVTRSFLRTGAMWSGVGLHFSDGIGGDVTAIRIMCLTANTTTQSEVKNLFLLLPGKVSLAGCEELGKHNAQIDDAKKQFPDVISAQRNQRPFSTALRKRLGIADEKAIELLQRTQSAKTLGDLNQLMRDFMLPEPNTFKIAHDAAENFIELKTAHGFVVEAREQIEKLRPIRDNANKYNELATRIAEYAVDLDAIPVYANHKRLQFATDALHVSEGELASAEATLADALAREKELAEQETNLRVAITGEKDEGITAAERRRDKLRDELDRVQETAEKFFAVLSSLTPNQPANQEDFINTRVQLEDAIEEIEVRKGTYKKTRKDIYTRIVSLSEKLDQNESAIKTAEQYQSNIDPRLLSARNQICSLTQTEEMDLPFVADLISIHSEETRWQGVAERVMGGFSRMLLVPHEHYPQVSAAVNSVHLGTKLTYIDFDAKLQEYRPQKFLPRSLGTKIDVKTGRFANWIQHQLSTRFNHICAETMEEFRAKERAVTEAGQVREGNRHVKDDRSRIEDRSRWVLFPNTENRIDLLTARQNKLRKKLRSAEKELQDFEYTVDKDEKFINNARRVLETENFSQIDVAGALAAVDAAQKDLDILVDNNDTLAGLQNELGSVLGLKLIKAKEIATLQQRIGVARNGVEKAQNEIESITAKLEGTELLTEDTQSRIAQRMKVHARTVNARNIDQVASDTERELRTEKSVAETDRAGIQRDITLAMSRFLDAWPARQGDLFPSIETTNDFLSELRRLEKDDLPRFETEFQERLFTATNTHLGRLWKAISTAASSMRKEIDKLNQSLKLVEFYPGRTLQIEVREALPAVAREFSTKLAEATEGTLENDIASAEQRFMRLSAVIEDVVESDKTTPRQRKLRLDTRWHVAFYGVEVDANGNRGAVYESAEGLSGGQAQKLSSFCLAAALRFRLTGMGESATKAKNSRVLIGDEVYPHYGTIILDEAFDRADAEFTRTSMEVFDRFGFHMVLATPEKLLQPVEDYIGGVLMVECPDRKHSRTSSLTIEEAEQNAVS
ncbi:MAG: ATP-binding protein [Corynebacterium glucuronolyticum]|nr:hypothetical protein [Corynebacterium glucuronolyticum]MDD7587258.1 ATP-binding protein [Mycobacteriaceae bacterium]MDY5834677.1 ATP-binding protein [Corynebacterium glucuronolyticum]